MPVSTTQVQIPHGKFGKVKAVEGDVGGQLLPILSKGLYTNPLDCIREYVQNSVDAGAKKVTIKVTGNSVTIHDNGSGMDEEQLLSSRKFGVSPKDLAENVGFRGIGIYSGYDLSTRLVMTTKRAGQNVRLIMRFDFAGMKKELDKNPAGSISLTQLLSEFTSFKSEPDPHPRSSYTTVQLEDINEVHFRKLANRNELRKYILQNLPVDFDPLFDYRDQINEQLNLHVQGFKAVIIELQSDGMEDEIVSKPTLKGLRPPVFGKITEDGKTIGFYWACLNKKNERLSEENILPGKAGHSFEPGEYQGFVYKCKGFTIGNRNQLYNMFKAGSGTLYRWYTGEIYAIDPAVVPNTARDDFETSPAKTRLEIAVKGTLEKLEDEADKLRQQAVADRGVAQALSDLQVLDAEIKKKGINSLDNFTTLVDIKHSLKKYRKKASTAAKEQADHALKRVDRLEKEIRTTVGRSASGSTKKPARGVTAVNLPFPTTPEEVPQEANKSLASLIQELELCDSPNCTKLIAAIDAAVSNVLGADSIAYKRIIEAVKAALEGDEE